MILAHRTDALPSPLIDVAIVGGGVSGTYAAYRLLKADPGCSPALSRMVEASANKQLNVELFEASDRIGGRLWSYYFPEVPDYPAELGGMQFSEMQQNVYGLCACELALEVGDATFFTEPNIQYFRKHRFNFDQYEPGDPTPPGYYPNVIPFFLDQREHHQPPIIVTNAIKRGIEGIDNLVDKIFAVMGGAVADKLEAIRELSIFLRNAKIAHDIQPLKGKSIYQCGFWNFLKNTLSIEAYQLCLNWIGNPSFYRNSNLYDSIIDFFSFALLPPYRYLKKGYQKLPKELAQRFTDMGGKLRLQHRVEKLDFRKFNDKRHGGEQTIALTIATPDKATPTVVYARNVILALPQRALELLDCESFIFEDSQFNKDINAVTPWLAGKLIMSYDKPWWEAIPYGDGKVPAQQITHGSSSTDLPLATCIYFGTQKNGMSLLVASMTDAIATEFWYGYRYESRFGFHDVPYSGVHSRKIEPGLSAPYSMVVEAQQQLKELHDFDDIPEPCAAIYFNWGQDPYGGGYHTWNPHLRSWEIMPRIRQPVPGRNIYLCGEAYSADQGWVEGAINTAERVLETYFDLPRPIWVDANYDFGP